MTGTAQSRLALAVLSGIVVISVGIALAELTWHLAGETGMNAGQPLAEAARQPDGLDADIGPVLALAPFGSASPAAASAPVETSLGLVLHGVVLAEPRDQSMAVIAAADGAPRTYGIGETLPGSAVLETVEGDSVTLRVAGRVERLSFPKGAQPQAGVSAIRATIPSSAGGTAPPGTPAIPRAAPPKTGAPDAIANDFRQRIASNPKTVMAEVGLSATPEGYRLEASMMPELKRAGLRPGDLVVRVNGVKVGNVETDRGLFDEVVASGRARIEVVRDGSLIIMTFPLR